VALHFHSPYTCS